MKNLYKIEDELYVISNNESINENDHIITQDGRLVEVSYLLSKDVQGGHKVILTTNKLLIKDGAQAIDNEFLEWFVENPRCKFVSINTIQISNDEFHYTICNYQVKEEQTYAWVGVIDENKYIPKRYNIKDIFQGKGSLPNFNTHTECQKWCDNNPVSKVNWEELENSGLDTPLLTWDNKQNDIEEAAREYDAVSEYSKYEIENAFISGAKYQAERMYSEEEVIAIVEKSRETGLTAEFLLLTEQFKKK
jgi:hypothetical protein